jgi:hypothetical protein
MKLLDNFFKKKKRKNAEVNNPLNATCIAEASIHPASGEQLPAAEVINRSLSFAINYAVNMQGISLQQEEMSAIMDIINGAIARTAKGEEAPAIPSKKARKSKKEQKAEDECRYSRMLHKFEDYTKPRYVFRYNAITDDTEVAKFVENPKELVFKPATPRVRATIVQEVQCANIDFWGCDVDRYLNSEKVVEYHPFLKYFEELPEWDGVDRVTPLAERVSSDKIWVNGFHRWMLATSAQWMGYARRRRGVSTVRANSVAPILISEEQGWGKSTFCRMLMPEELQNYYTDSFDVARPSSCEVKLMDYGIINLDEFDRIPEKRGAQLKNLMQMTALNIRKAYKRNASACFRLASFIGTSNSRALLTDKSGSRRFLCVELEHPIDCDTPIEYEQLYAQLKHEILSGERYWFSKKEEAEIQENNAIYYKEVPMEVLFNKTFREVDSKAEGAGYYSADDIFKILKTTYSLEMAGVNVEKLNRLLPSIAHRQHVKGGSRYCLVLKEK